MSDMYCLYQLKDIPENEPFMHRSFEYVISNGGSVTENRYDMVYRGILLNGMDALKVRSALKQKPRQTFSKRAPGCGDVITLSQSGRTDCYFMDEIGLVPIKGFYANMVSVENPLNPASVNVRIDGKQGTWRVSDAITVESSMFFRMENVEHGDRAASLICDTYGNIISDNVTNDFDERARKRILAYIHGQRKQTIRETDISDIYGMPSGTGQQHNKPITPAHPSQRESLRKRLKEKQAMLKAYRPLRETNNKNTSGNI